MQFEYVLIALNMLDTLNLSEIRLILLGIGAMFEPFSRGRNMVEERGPSQSNISKHGL